MSSREAILDRIRAALADVDPGRPADTAPRDYASQPVDDVVATFATMVAEYRATVHRTDDPAATIASVLDDEGASSVVVAPDLADELLALLPDEVAVHRDDPDAPLGARDLDAIDAVVTTSRLGIAATGTVVLDHGPGQGRRALTLVPDLHVCLVVATHIVADVPDAISRLDARRPQTWISGPSATSDIELDRVEGVHGPRRLHMVIVDRPPTRRTGA